MIVEILFAEQPVLADSESLIGCEKDHRVGGLCARVEGVEHAPDLGVEVADDGVILLEMNANDRGRARMRREDLVAAVESLDGKWMSWEKIRRQTQLPR